MQMHQRMSLLFYRKTKKKDKDGYIPLYCRITIDGLKDEMSTGCKVLCEEWDSKTKTVLSTNRFHKVYNKKISQMRTDLERHFDLVVAKNGVATPHQVKTSYQAPAPANRQKEEKAKNELFSEQLDLLIKDHIRYDRQLEKVQDDPVGQDVKLQRLSEVKIELDNRLRILVKEGNQIFDDKKWTKTFVLAVNEYLLNFLELVMSNERAANTLKKKWGTKNRLLEFMHVRYKLKDIPLAELEYKFITEFAKNEQTIHKNEQNTIWKYVQIINEIIDRSVANGWMSYNLFANFECKYVEPDDKLWPTMDEMIHLINFQFDDPHLSDMKYVFVYQSFAGPSYAELFALRERHLMIEGGKTWVDQRRRKSKSREFLPLLPICLDIIEMFKNHPRCLRTGKLLPVPSDQHYNRCIKRMGEIAKIPCLNNSHQARYFFANEVAFASNDNLTLTSMLLGQRNPRSVNTYVKQSKKKIETSMAQAEKMLYTNGGPLFSGDAEEGETCKIISLKRRIIP